MISRPPAHPPKPGEVIRFAYLWREEADRGQDEGRKDRPCAVVLAARREGDRTTVLVAPITHTPPGKPGHGVEIPADTKRRLRLDDAPSWIVTTELNAFTWPGPDVRHVAQGGDSRGFTYGTLPSGLTRRVVDRALERVREGQTRPINRDEPAQSRADYWRSRAKEKAGPSSIRNKDKDHDRER